MKVDILTNEERAELGLPHLVRKYTNGSEIGIWMGDLEEPYKSIEGYWLATNHGHIYIVPSRACSCGQLPKGEYARVQRSWGGAPIQALHWVCLGCGAETKWIRYENLGRFTQLWDEGESAFPSYDKPFTPYGYVGVSGAPAWRSANG